MTQPHPDEPASPPSVSGPESGPAANRLTRGSVGATVTRPERRRDSDSDLVDHDLSDHDEPIFRSRSPWPHLRTLGLTFLIAGLILTGGAAKHLADMSARTIGNAVLLPIDVPVNIRLDAGEERMLYTERGSGTTRCEVTDGANAPVAVSKTSPVILQGSDVLWHGQSLFAAPRDGDYTIRCHGGADARVGTPVGTLDVVLTVLAAGLGGLGALVGLALFLWGRRRSGRVAGAQDRA